MQRLRVLIYRDRLLPISETFVRHHYDSLQNVEVAIAGLRSVPGVDMSGTRRILLERGGRDTVGAALFKLWGHAPRLIDTIREFAPDVIHAHFAVDAVDMLPVAARLNVPLVVTLHGYDVTYSDRAFRRLGPVGWNFLAKRQRLMDRAALFLPVSRYIEECALACGYPAARMRTHYLGVDLSRFSTGEAIGRRAGVLFVGRLVEKKGLNHLIEAMARLPEPLRHTELRIIGDGPLRATWQALAASRGVNAVFEGAKSHKCVVEAMRQARVFSMPSLRAANGDNEGLGLTYLEAQACGTPVVAFAQGGIVEAIEDGATGFLVAEGDVDVLSERLSRLLQDERLCVQMGARGVERVATQFSIDTQARKLERLYRDVASAAGGSAVDANGESSGPLASA